MLRVDPRRIRPSRWPWLLGLGALVLIGWGVGVILAPQPEPPAAVPDSVAATPYPPAAIPLTAGAVAEAPAPPRLDQLAPLDDHDSGRTARIEGVVVDTGSHAFWIRSGRTVLRVDSPRHVRTGDSLSVTGTLKRDPDAGTWRVIRPVTLMEATPASRDTARADRPT